ncbi:MAG: hypothetical protein QM820_65470 [Minicystis sp.]
MEGRGAGRGLVEGLLPVALEVDGVGEDEARLRVDAAFGDEILDAILGLALDPVVDALAAALGIGLEIEDVEGRAEGGLGLLDVGAIEGVALLAEEAVGDAHRGRLLGVPVARDQRAGDVHRLIGRALEVEDLLHLRGCLAAGAGPGEREGGGEARRGDGEVALLRADLAVDVEAEGVVALRQGGEIGGRGRGAIRGVGGGRGGRRGHRERRGRGGRRRGRIAGERSERESEEREEAAHEGDLVAARVADRAARRGALIHGARDVGPIMRQRGLAARQRAG